MNAIYLRVSKGRGQDIASQEPDLKRWESAQDVPSRRYVDKATGKNMNRPGFQTLLDDVRTGKVKTIVIWRLDRLGRTAKGLTALLDELIQRKVNLISLREGIDLSTPAGRMMANVIASIAQYETEVRAERIHAGLAVARANGKRLGRKPGDGKGVRIKVTADEEVLVRRLKTEGESVSKIARLTKLSRMTVYSIIRTVPTP
jgi:DNA invertase Pin-like site-specific DNA recombinase